MKGIKITSARYTEAAVDKFPAYNDAGNFKHELLNRLRSTMAVNVLMHVWPCKSRKSHLL